MKVYKISWLGDALGDQLLAAWVVNILNFNNVPCALSASPKVKNLINCCDFYFSNSSFKEISLRLDRTKRKDPKFTILTDLLYFFLCRSKEKISLNDIDIKNAPHPIKYKDNTGIKGVDVCLVTTTGHWTPYRNWPYFNNLKELFKKNNISYIDLSEEKIKNFEFLNYVKKSKIYLGLETGASHYAAPFIKDKGFIIQSGYCDFNYWAAHYNYQKIEHSVQCAPCWKRRGCQHDHKCMRKIPASLVYNKITKIIND